MTRDQLIALLARMLAGGEITESAAHTILDEYEAGHLPAIAAPLPPVEAIAGLDPELWDKAGLELARLAATGRIEWE